LGAPEVELMRGLPAEWCKEHREKRERRGEGSLSGSVYL
jgi:hypothetical protein